MRNELSAAFAVETEKMFGYPRPLTDMPPEVVDWAYRQLDGGSRADWLAADLCADLEWAERGCAP